MCELPMRILVRSAASAFDASLGAVRQAYDQGMKGAESRHFLPGDVFFGLQMTFSGIR